MASRLFDPGTLTWEVNHEPAVFLGGGRALLMQVAHPLVAAGVGDHSDYRAHPWRRLVRTLDTTLKIAFAPEPVAKAAASRLSTRHRGVRGETPDGRPYDAGDPALGLWVWATLVDTAFDVYGRAVRRLADGELERLYREQRRFAVACGVPDDAVPGSWWQFAAYVERTIARDLEMTPVARDVCAAVLQPFEGRLARVGTPLMLPGAAITAVLLPARLRALYGLQVTEREERIAAAVFAASRAGCRLTPRPLRHAPVHALVRLPTPGSA